MSYFQFNLPWKVFEHFSFACVQCSSLLSCKICNPCVAAVPFEWCKFSKLSFPLPSFNFAFVTWPSVTGFEFMALHSVLLLGLSSTFLFQLLRKLLLWLSHWNPFQPTLVVGVCGEIDFRAPIHDFLSIHREIISFGLSLSACPCFFMGEKYGLTPSYSNINITIWSACCILIMKVSIEFVTFVPDNYDVLFLPGIKACIQKIHLSIFPEASSKNR